MMIFAILILLHLLNITSCYKSDWNLDSWKTKKIYQIPEYKDKEKLNSVLNKIAKSSPIIFAGECENLKYSIAKACYGKSFLLFGGDCAELFDEFSIDKIRDDYRLILQMGMVLTYGTNLPTIKIGRIAGQFAKPRSEEYEKIDEKKILTYRGDIINDYSINNRDPEPERMLNAYYQSIQTLNILRGFSSGGYADINRIHLWNLDFAKNTHEGSTYNNIANKITKSLKFLNGLGVDTNSDIFRKTDFYTSHECLLLPYEQALTRKDSTTNKYYDCSSHFLWIGERTRQIDGAHIEFLRGVNNPIGIKLSDKVNIEEIIKIIKILNPENIPGRITLIIRMGAENIKNILPKLIEKIKQENLLITWCCDPMHANTIKLSNGIKTRNFNDIKNEIFEYFKVHRMMNTFPGGIHLELTSKNVTECVGGKINKIKESDLLTKYLSHCDPRLNPIQSLEIAFMIANLSENY